MGFLHEFQGITEYLGQAPVLHRANSQPYEKAMVEAMPVDDRYRNRPVVPHGRNKFQILSGGKN